jgi:hypothetical protein
MMAQIIPMNERMISEELIGKDVEGSCCGPLQGIIRHLSEGAEESRKDLGQDSWSLGAGLIQGTPDYAVRVLTFGLTSFLI